MAAEGQQHPIGIYLWVWLALSVVSALSYYVDWAGFQGVTVELDFVFHVCESGRHCMGVYAYGGTPCLIPIMLPTIFMQCSFYNGIRGDYIEVVRLNFFSDWQNFSVERH